jgi:glycosyltransferase involved in cell wall biosynthesis
MQAAKFLVLPSIRKEMFPVTVLEAFSNCLPVICSDLSSLRELVEPGITGLTFPPGDASALAAQVRWALSNASAFEEIGCRGQSVYEVRYTPEVNFSQLMSVYQSLRRERLCRGDGRSESEGCSRLDRSSLRL